MSESRVGDVDVNRAVDEPRWKRSRGACRACHAKKRRCDRGHPCRQCFSRSESHMCSYAETEGRGSRRKSIGNMVTANEAGGPAELWHDPVHAELVALRQTVGELQDRVWRTEVQLAAAGSSHSLDSGNVKSNDKIEKALEEMVALVTHKYSDLERENRRLSAQVTDMQVQLRAQAQFRLRDASYAPKASQNGGLGHSEHHIGEITGTNGAQSQHLGVPQPHIVALGVMEPGHRPYDGGSGRPRKRHCVSHACIPCKNRKSKCDGVRSGCDACSYHETECLYNLSLDQRRKEAVPLEQRAQGSNDLQT